MSKKTYHIIIYSFVSILIFGFLFLGYNARRLNRISNQLIAVNLDGKLICSEIIASDSVKFYKNIEEQISNANRDSILLLSYFLSDSSEVKYPELIKFTINSFRHLRVTIGDFEPLSENSFELEILVKNFDNLSLKIVFVKEEENYKIVDIINLVSYLKSMESIFDYHGLKDIN